MTICRMVEYKMQLVYLQDMSNSSLPGGYHRMKDANIYCIVAVGIT